MLYSLTAGTNNNSSWVGAGPNEALNAGFPTAPKPLYEIIDDEGDDEYYSPITTLK